MMCMWADPITRDSLAFVRAVEFSVNVQMQHPPGRTLGSCKWRFLLCGGKSRKAGTEKSKRCPGREVNLRGCPCPPISRQGKMAVGKTSLHRVHVPYERRKNSPSYIETAAGWQGL